MVAVIAILVLAGGAWLVMRPGGDVGEGSLAANRPYTLSPAQFSHDPKAQSAYQVAKDIPEVLEQLPCFCGCKDGLDHKNNLFCFKDQHGAACDMCQSIALDARTMHEKGMATDQIRQNIIDRYSRAH